MSQTPQQLDHRRFIRLAGLVLLLNILLMFVKIGVGYVGNSYALIADGLESASDLFISLLTWAGFFMSLQPPDAEHPFGHGKIESLAGLLSGLFLVGAAVGIAAFSIREILIPHHVPAWYTLPVLLLVVAAKEMMARQILANTRSSVESRALEGDAWHHRSDALTSAAAAIGIAVALIGGEGWAMADDWAALFACFIIAFNGIRIARNALHENLDGSVNPSFATVIRNKAEGTTGVYAVETCRVRKSGIGYFVELHLEVDEAMTVKAGHALGHQVKEQLLNAFPRLLDVVVHLEPHGSLGPAKRNP